MAHSWNQTSRGLPLAASGAAAATALAKFYGMARRSGDGLHSVAGAC
jgi:hypothetical protein